MGEGRGDGEGSGRKVRGERKECRGRMNGEREGEGSGRKWEEKGGRG